MDSYGTAFIVEGRLDGELLPLLEFMLPFLSDFNDYPGKFMAGDGGMFRNVVGYPLVFDTGMGGLIGGHADVVAYHLGKDFIVLHLGKLKLLKSEIFLPIHTYCFGFHILDNLIITLMTTSPGPRSREWPGLSPRSAPQHRGWPL